MDEVSTGPGLHANGFNGTLHKLLRRGLIQSWLSDFSQFGCNKEGQDTLHKDALALIFLMEALREEIYKSLGGGGSKNTHITSIGLICSHGNKNNQLTI